MCRGGCRIFEKGGRGPTLGPMLESLHRGPKEGAYPRTPPGSAILVCEWVSECD